ncbi:MAG: hypothetical protein H0V82_03400 [Candidatus Protochlamydia sp.]|nr:hypothetical protein [Candidatus Protochlamydia sp.]
MSNPINHANQPHYQRGFVGKPVFQEAVKHCEKTFGESEEGKSLTNHFNQQIAHDQHITEEKKFYQECHAKKIVPPEVKQPSSDKNNST